MIVNHEIIEKKYKCGRNIMQYLTYKCHLPLLSFDGDYFYFANTCMLKAALDNMPLHLKIISFLTK